MAKKKVISFDWAMRSLLRSREHFDILAGFLSELLRDDIHILEVLDRESNKKDRRRQFNRMDLMVKNRKSEILIIEVQCERESDCLQRMLCGTSKIITEHIQEGKPYSEIVKVISVNILYFDLGQGEDYIYQGSTSFKGMHRQDILQLSDDQREIYRKDQLHHIFPEYYLIKVHKFEDVINDPLDEWIYFLKHEKTLDTIKARGLEKAGQVLSLLQLSDQERYAYERYREDLHYRSNLLYSSYTLGIRKGVKQGIKEGVKQGVRQGLLQGERKKALEIAVNLIDVLDAQTIARKTGLSEEEIIALQRPMD